MTARAHKLRHRLAALVLLGASVAVLGGALLDRWVTDTVLPPLVVATSTTVLDRDGQLLRAYTIDDGLWRLPLTTASTDTDYLRALIAFEDKRFERHAGVDVLAMIRAAAQALWHQRIISGGSTLTMQVARLLEDGGTGRIGPKLRQIRVALALERHLEKNEILNLYLQLAPFGGNLEGVRAASLAYFGREPERLTPAQASLLVALPQSPETRRPDRFAAQARAARDRALDRFKSTDIWTLSDLVAAKREAVPTARRQFPAIAPHEADRVVAAAPSQAEHRLALRRDLQVSMERLVAAEVGRLSPQISAAIVVMDHRSGEIVAAVGSPGLFEDGRRGFIDMTRAIRSPGSTLKPLIYGLAFDAGIAHPETYIEDRPTAFGSYVPQNFDKQFRGTIRVREALQLSLNIPAVALLDAVGPAILAARIKASGAALHLPGDSKPGLAIGLGGVGITLRDLVTLYGAIAAGGQSVQPRLTFDDTDDDLSRTVLSPEAAWHVGDILAGAPTPPNAPKNLLAFKTGTSYGHRDTWAIGYDGAHVIGIWFGRPDGASMPGEYGADLAAPILFEAFARLKPELTPRSVPPASTLMVNNANLPLPLRTFRRRNAVFEAAADGPQIAYPPNGAHIALGLNSDAEMPLVLKVRNGTAPFTWLADGVPVEIAGFSRQLEYRPTGPGVVSISVIDALGKSQQASVWID